MTDREWADRLHEELGGLLYCMDAIDKGIDLSGMLSTSRVLSLRLFKKYKEQVQKLDYETGSPL